MYYKLITNDVRKSKIITVTITLFIFLAALLTSVAATLIINLFSAIDNMMLVSQTPNLMYMHSGEIDYEALQTFAEADSNVEAYQVLNFLNLEGSQIVLNGNSLSESIQDNAIVTQSGQFDFLLGLDGGLLDARDGEIYVPVYYMQEFDLKAGQQASVNGIPFTIAGFVRDPLFNASMASAKRFLVSQGGYDKLAEAGRLEYLIEFLFHDVSQAGSFITAYADAGLPTGNLPAVTQDLLRIMNALSDGIMISVLILISLLIIIITFLCIRFTLLAKTEEDYREIGVLKAIGLRVSGIKRLYLAKYGVITAIACILGFLTGLPLQGLFMKSIELYLGQSGKPRLALIVGLAGAALIFPVIIIYVNSVLSSFRKISAAQAVRFGAPAEKSKNLKNFRLSENRLFSINVFLGFQDVLARKKLYITMLLVLVISTFILIIPQNLYNTINSRRFMTNIGVGECDMIIVVQQTDDIKQKAAEISEALSHNADVSAHNAITTYSFAVDAGDGTTQALHVALGDHSVFPIEYSKGRMPQSETDIAISTLIAEDLGKTVGDELTLIAGESEIRLKICGIYSDLLNMGRTSRATFATDQAAIWQSSISVLLHDRGKVDETAAFYKNAYPFAKALNVNDYITQTIGTVAAALRSVSIAAVAAAALLTALITILFIKMLVAKDRYNIAVLKSSGFTSRAIQSQYIVRTLTVLCFSVILGTVLANTLGEYVGIFMLSSFGQASFHFEINPLYAYLFAPALLAACVYLSARLSLSGISSLKVYEHIKEA